MLNLHSQHLFKTRCIYRPQRILAHTKLSRTYWCYWESYRSDWTWLSWSSNDLMPRWKELPDQKHFSVLCRQWWNCWRWHFCAFQWAEIWWVGGPGNAEELLYSNIGSRDVELQSYNDKLHVTSVQGPLSRYPILFVSVLSECPTFWSATCRLVWCPVTITRTGYTAEWAMIFMLM